MSEVRSKPMPADVLEQTVVILERSLQACEIERDKALAALRGCEAHADRHVIADTYTAEDALADLSGIRVITRRIIAAADRRAK